MNQFYFIFIYIIVFFFGVNASSDVLIIPNVDLKVDINADANEIINTLINAIKDANKGIYTLLRPSDYEDFSPSTDSRFISFVAGDYIFATYYHKSEGHIAYVLGKDRRHSCAEPGEWATAITSRNFLTCPFKFLRNILTHFEWHCNVAFPKVKNFKKICDPKKASENDFEDDEFEIDEDDLNDAVFFDDNGNIIKNAFINPGTIDDSKTIEGGKCIDKEGICIDTDVCKEKNGIPGNCGYCPDTDNNMRCCSIPCEAYGKPGKCMFSDDCNAVGGTSYYGLCPFGSNFKCCTSANNNVGKSCESNGFIGTCIDINSKIYSCHGEIVDNKCPGGNNIKCCINSNDVLVASNNNDDDEALCDNSLSDKQLNNESESTSTTTTTSPTQTSSNKSQGHSNYKIKSWLLIFLIGLGIILA